MDLTLQGNAIEREICLVKVKGEGEHRSEALRLAAAFGAKTLDATLNSFVFELTGATEEIDRFVRLMSVIGLVRSAGRVSAPWGAGRSRCRIRRTESARMRRPRRRRSDGSQGHSHGRTISPCG